MVWPTDRAFSYNNVHMQSAGPHVHWHDSRQFCTTSTLKFFLYRTRCRGSILVQEYRNNKPLATIMRALFTRGGLGHHHSCVHPLPDSILHHPIRIVNLDGDRWWWELDETLGPGNLQKMHSHVQEARNTVKMDRVFLEKALDRFQGLQAQVVLASLVSATPGIMHDIWRSNTLTSRAQSELHLFGRFTGWDVHAIPGAWIAALHAVQWEAGSCTVGTTFELARVLTEAGVVERVMEGTIYRLAGGVLGPWL